jgi:hypothetical protein
MPSRLAIGSGNGSENHCEKRGVGHLAPPWFKAAQFERNDSASGEPGFPGRPETVPAA